MTIDQIRRDIDSGSAADRTRALLKLFEATKKDPAIRGKASELFRTVLERFEEPSNVSLALQGLELSGGAQQAREHWIKLLNHPRVEMAAYAAMAISDPNYVPILIELLLQRPEPFFHIAAISALGRLRLPSGFPAIAEHLKIPETQIYAIEALANLGDLRAIPILEPLLEDTRDMPETDERGATRRICEVADEAIRRIRRRPIG